MRRLLEAHPCLFHEVSLESDLGSAGEREEEDGVEETRPADAGGSE